MQFKLECVIFEIMEKCKLAIVDDKVYNVQILEDKLAAKKDVDIRGGFYSGETFLAWLQLTNELPDIVFMDIDMPVMDGIETVRRAKRMFPGVHFIMITVFDDQERIFNAIQAGASGYLLKDEPVKNLHRAIDDVLAYGAAPFAPAIAMQAFSYIQSLSKETMPTAETPLSEREMDILSCLADGLSYTLIAEKLFISPHTVRKHMTNIYEKLHVNSKVEAVRKAIDNKWLNRFY